MDLPPPAADPGFVASPVARIATAALAAIDPAYSPARFDRPVPRAEQADTLRRLLAAGGPGAVLSAGRQIRALEPDPILIVLLNSASVAVLLEKVDRLNRFLHSHHRWRILDLADTRLLISHVSERVEPPSPIESLFVAGLLIVLLEEIGASGVRCRFPESPVDGDVVVDGTVEGPVPQVGTQIWDVRWSTFAPRRPLPGLDAVLADRFGPDLELPDLVHGVRTIMAADVARRWSVAAVASELAMSRRTLQRRLAAAGTSFSKELAVVRVGAARELLVDRRRSITEVAYLCGFADGAHFARAFRSATGSAPREWRSALPF
jgi:AraC-like DNA-binding protein